MKSREHKEEEGKERKGQQTLTWKRWRRKGTKKGKNEDLRTQWWKETKGKMVRKSRKERKKNRPSLWNAEYRKKDRGQKKAIPPSNAYNLGLWVNTGQMLSPLCSFSLTNKKYICKRSRWDEEEPGPFSTQDPMQRVNTRPCWNTIATGAIPL